MENKFIIGSLFQRVLFIIILWWLPRSRAVGIDKYTLGAICSTKTMGALCAGNGAVLHHGCGHDWKFSGGLHVFSVRFLQIYMLLISVCTISFWFHKKHGLNKSRVQIYLVNIECKQVNKYWVMLIYILYACIADE